jgi:CRISPR-associated endonuclease/helicase Cas3
MMTKKSDERPFQKKVRGHLLRGAKVILQAPTGVGKTRAALAPFVQNLASAGHALPHTCLYATPLRVLATQFYQEYMPRMDGIDQHKGTDYLRQYQRLGRPLTSIQTGEQPDDPKLESLLTFCTIDQLLASFLSVPYSIGRRSANLNVGAVLGSYLVLDEFHLYPLLHEGESCFGARTTALVMLALLRGITPFTLMTATFSSKLLERLKELLHAEVVIVDNEEELNDIAQGRRRYFEVAGTAMSAEAILARHEGCSLVICNTVLRAQRMYWEIRELAHRLGIEVVLLHSRLTDADRISRSKKIMREFGPAPDTWSGDERYGWKDGRYYGKNLIVVATQVVEVGLDISVQTLHTEIAPASSLIQRAGRCARFAQQEGRVIVYDLPTENGKPVTTLPYDKKLCDATFAALGQLDLTQPVGFREEQKLIDAVHTAEDLDLIERFARRRDEIEKLIFSSFKEPSTSVISTLIRDVAQVQVLIHDDPQQAITTEPWRWQSFALHPATLAAHLPAFEEQRDVLGADWICKEASAYETEQDAEGDSRQVTRYKWDDLPFSPGQRVRERQLRAALMVALPNQFATYHKELGFVLRDERLPIPWTTYQSTPREGDQKGRSKPPPIKQQCYRQHIEGLVHAYNTGIAQHIAYAAQRLEALLALPAGSIDHALRLALACHDLGKLSEKWQQWAWEWQRLLYEREGRQPYQHDAAFFFAKTDFDSSTRQREWQRDMQTKRPNHACESVALGYALIAGSLGIAAPGSVCIPLWRAVCGAIAHHHTPTAHESAELQLKAGAAEAIREALEAARQNLPWSYDLAQIRTEPQSGFDLAPANGTPFITRPERGQLQERETWLYFLIVRALRLADQRADDFSLR